MFSLAGPNLGRVYTLPHFGRSRWENIVLNPYEQDLTIAMMTDDRFPVGILVRREINFFFFRLFVCLCVNLDFLFFVSHIYIIII
jgi:hypothetical protein